MTATPMLSPITIWPTRPPLAAIVAAYMEPPAPYTKREAVHAAVADRMAIGRARGHGNRAARRAPKLKPRKNAAPRR